MAVRKSKKIGTVVKGYLVLDSRHEGTTTYFYLECQKCGERFWKSNGFIKSKAICPYCERGKIDHNADGYRHERLYYHYKMILQRARHHERYKDVEVCREWVEDYRKFREWALANGYADGLTIDRIDNSKGYFPENCRWATMRQQANNRSSNIVVTYRGDTDTVANLARKYGKDRGLIYQRLRAGWSVEDSFDRPVNKSKWSRKRKESGGVQTKGSVLAD